MKKAIIALLFIGNLVATFSQDLTVLEKQKELKLDDAVLGYYKGLYPKSFRNLTWLKNTAEFCYLDNNNLEIHSAKNNKLIRKITYKELLQVVPSLKYYPPVQQIDKTHFVFENNGTYYYYNYKKKTIDNKIEYNTKGQNIDFNLSTKNIAYTIDNNLYINNQPITHHTDKNIVSGQAIHRFEFGISKGTFWSPTNNLLAFYEKDETNVGTYALLDINETPAKTNEIKYPMAGQKNEVGKVGIYNLENKRTIYLKTDSINDIFLTNLTWSPDAQYIYLAEVNRAQNHMWLTQYDATTGDKIATLFEEENEKWVEPEHGLYFLPNSNTDFLYLSERDGFMNIYHYHHEQLEQITAVKWVIDDILGFDTKGENVIFIGTGEDPRELHAFKVNLGSKKIEKITKNNGVHHVQYSKKANAIIDDYSNITTPRTTLITPLKKGKNITILKAENPLKEYKYGTTEFITLRAKTGENLYGRMIKPKDFDPNKKYPVLVYVYGGPHAQLVTNNWLGGASLWMYWMAEQGYIVFTLDGRGSAHRGFNFESQIHRHLGDVEIEDQLTGVEFLKSLPYTDVSRMAVHGWSFGGFMTTSLMLKQPGVFTTGVAGGPVIDWKWYEIMYGERYMDTPQENKEGYKNASLLNYAKDLEGKLLLIHGTIDDVVVPQHSLAMVQAFVKANKQMDFFPYPMHPHNVRGRDRVHLMTKVLNYILENNK